VVGDEPDRTGADDAAVTRAAEAIRDAEALLITAGAGMGVDSGLPDFRGNEGFWNAYPPYRRIGKSFVEMANPDAFSSDPPFAWGFYGHRLHLYRETDPHPGFTILSRWAEGLPGGSFVMTSNVDGHFQRAGFSPDRVYEVHGSLFHLQCTLPCRSSGIWPAGELVVDVDPGTMRARGDLPSCPSCGRIARPNILMFGDGSYLAERNEDQRARIESWLRTVRDRSLAVIEFGAGTAVPTVRFFSEDMAGNLPGATLIRVNPREPEIPGGKGISLSTGALAAIRAIDDRL